MNKCLDIIRKNRADIFMAAGIGSIVFGGVLAVKNTPKACKILEEKEDSNTDKMKKLAPLYLPSILLTVTGISQIIYSRNINKNKLAAVATAYTTSELTYKTFRDKVRENMEPDRYEKVKREVAEERLRTKSINKEVVIQTKGDVLMYDSMSGRYFRGNMDSVERAVNYLNKRMMSEMTVSLNELYIELELPTIKIGSDMGWCIDNHLIDIDFSTAMADNNEPCIVMDYNVIPI